MDSALTASMPLSFETVTAGVQLLGGTFLLVGWAVEETTAVAGARIVIRDGLTSGGRYRVPITLVAGESTRDIMPVGGILFELGLFVDVTAGSVSGTMFVILDFDEVGG